MKNEGSKQAGVGKKVFSGIMLLTLVFTILAIFFFLVTWGLMELSVLMKH